MSRNPLKSGQCFLPYYLFLKVLSSADLVAIPSNRVNVSYAIPVPSICRDCDMESQSPQIGSMFPTKKIKSFEEGITEGVVAIPSNRVNVSYKTPCDERVGACRDASQSPQIGSMFPTSPRLHESRRPKGLPVAIPSNRVNVSYLSGKIKQGTGFIIS